MRLAGFHQIGVNAKGESRNETCMAPASKDDTHMVALAQEKQCVASSGFLGGVSVGSWGLLGFAAGSDLRGSSFALVCSLSSVLCVIQSNIDIILRQVLKEILFIYINCEMTKPA